MEPEERDTVYLADFGEAIRRIDRSLESFDRERFLEDELRQDAVVRNLEKISEASQRLSESLKAQHPEIDWHAVAGAGNVHRHDYGAVDYAIIWETARGGLEPLRGLVKIG